MIGSLLVARILLGICEAPIYPAAGRTILHWVAKSERALSNGVVITGSLLGSAITSPVVSYLMVHLGWRNAMAAVSVVAPVLVIVWLVYATNDPREHSRVNASELRIIGIPEGTREQNMAPVRALKVVLRSRQVWRLSAAYGLQCYLGYIFIWWGYIYLVEVRKFSLVHGGFVNALPFLIGTVTTPTAGELSDWLTGRCGHRWGRRVIPVIALLAAAILVFVGARVEDARLAVVTLSVGAALSWVPEGPTWASMLEIASPVAGTAGGFLNTGGNLGGALAAVLTPWIVSEIGWIGAFAVASLFAVTGSVLWMGVDPTKRVVTGQAPC